LRVSSLPKIAMQSKRGGVTERPEIATRRDIKASLGVKPEVTWALANSKWRFSEENEFPGWIAASDYLLAMTRIDE